MSLFVALMLFLGSLTPHTVCAQVVVAGHQVPCTTQGHRR